MQQVTRLSESLLMLPSSNILEQASLSGRSALRICTLRVSVARAWVVAVAIVQIHLSQQSVVRPAHSDKVHRDME